MSVPSKIEYPFRVVHVEGCGADMFFLKRRPVGGGNLVSADAIYPGGQTVDRESAVMCHACGGWIVGNPRVEWVSPRE